MARPMLVLVFLFILSLFFGRQLSISFILFMLAVFAIRGFKYVFSSKQEKGLEIWIACLAYVLIAVGVTGFLGSSLSAFGGLNWLPPSFEWPVGYSEKIISTGNGYYAVPLPSSRIQIYNSDWKFIRGWYVEAGGGEFWTYPAEKDHIEVVTARGNHHYVFNTDGDLISSTSYQSRSYPNPALMTFFVPTKPWLLPFFHPIAGWMIAGLGMLILKLCENLAPKKKQNWENVTKY